MSITEQLLKQEIDNMKDNIYRCEISGYGWAPAAKDGYTKRLEECEAELRKIRG